MELSMSESDKDAGKRADRRANTHIERVAAWLPRAMRAGQAAEYLSMSRSTFLKLVDEGKMPKPIKIGAMSTWDRYDIDAAFEDLKNPDPEDGNTMHKILGIRS
jgi:predicted DNA-binding transcriptional regulator AlpA